MTKNSLPSFVPPTMVVGAKAPFDSPDWIFEIKLDGYRAITVFDSADKSRASAIILSARPASPPYLKYSGKLEVAQQIANHESPRTTKRYDRRQDEISLDEIERITI